MAEGDCRAIDRDLDLAVAVALQVGQVGTGMAQHPQVQVDDQAVGFGNADKTVGPEQAMLRMLPAYQRFQFGHVPTAQVEDRLVVHTQPALFKQRQAQLFFQLQGDRRASLQAVIEEIQAVASVVLGLVEGQVGMLEQLFGCAAIVREDTYTNAGGHDHVPSAQVDGVFHPLHDALGQVAGFVAAVQAGDHAELVATKTRNQVVAAGSGLDVVGDYLEQLVTGVVAEAVVDALEMVDVEEHHGQAVFAGLSFDQTLGENLVESAAVEQVGQGIIVRRLLQRSAGLVQLAEQYADPAQVVLLALQLLVGQCGADAGATDQQGDEADAQSQLQAVVARRQAQCGIGRDDQGHGRHRGEMSGDDAARHEQAGAVLHGLVQGAAAIAQVARQVQRGQGGEQGNGGRGK